MLTTGDWIALASGTLGSGLLSYGVSKHIVNRMHRRKTTVPHAGTVIGIDGDHYVVMEVRISGDGSKSLYLIDEGTFVKNNRLDLRSEG